MNMDGEGKVRERKGGRGGGMGEGMGEERKGGRDDTCREGREKEWRGGDGRGEGGCEGRTFLSFSPPPLFSLPTSPSEG